MQIWIRRCSKYWLWMICFVGIDTQGSYCWETNSLSLSICSSIFRVVKQNPNTGNKCLQFCLYSHIQDIRGGCQGGVSSSYNLYIWQHAFLLWRPVILQLLLMLIIQKIAQHFTLIGPIEIAFQETSGITKLVNPRINANPRALLLQTGVLSFSVWSASRGDVRMSRFARENK